MFEITSVDFSITDAIRYEIEAMGSLLSKHLSDNDKVKVTLSKVAPDVFNVHMQTHYLGEDIVCDQQDENFHRALDQCKHGFIKQVDKRRSKIQDRS